VLLVALMRLPQPQAEPVVIGSARELDLSPLARTAGRSTTSSA